MRKMTLYGAEARAKILEGVNKISAAVKCTLGPSGRNVLISQSVVVDYGVHSLPIHVTKDGYTTTKGFDIDDPFAKAGVLLVKEAAQKTVDQAGDGTTTTVVLMEAIVSEGIKMIEAGANPMELKRGIDKAVEYVVEELKKMAVKIGDDNEKIFQIATISANNDAVIGRLIADAFKKIGNEGIIDIEAGSGVETEIKIADGYQWERGWVSPLFVNNKEKQICEFTNPIILIYQNRVIHHTQVMRALELSVSSNRPILIICEDAAEEGLAFLAMNNVQQRARVCVVKAPAFGDARREAMEDLALLTGGSYISDIRGINVKEIEFENFGKAKKVIVTKEETIIVEGEGDPKEIENLINELRMNLTQAKNEDEKAPIEKRIAKLKGGVAVIQVGAATETEMKEKLDRFDDAVRATKAAIQEGFIRGGGCGFRDTVPYVADMIRANKNIFSKDFLTGIDILRYSLSTPLKQICENAGIDYNKINDQLSTSEGFGKGYNAKTDTIEDLIQAGVIDPVKVIRCSLQNAASSAGMLLTTEALICDTL